MDYCTLWFEGWWAHCCQAHDEAYASTISRALADENLFQCVLTSTSSFSGMLVSAGIGAVMFAGVRLFGGRYRKKAQQKPDE